MGSIRILSDRVANQIAAGEVVERPVAVIKELVENSLDAQATRIEVTFTNGGRALMRVADNGLGMAPDDALLALERHATSKIHAIDDILSVSSFGFRGEALPSIASVSRFSMRTRPAGRDSGVEILVQGGKHLHTQACGMPVGTRIDVANLFSGVPARRKFLKSDRTEAAHIIQFCRLIAVAHPNVAFTLVENEHEVFRSPICSTLRDRVMEIFGKQLTADLIDIDASESAHLRIWGLIGAPGHGRATRANLFTYVNRRIVDSRTLNYALIESYHTYLPKGRYPVAFLFLEIDPRMVDVNVHPAKREVRFRDEGMLRRFVIESVLKRLRDASAPVRQLVAPVAEPYNAIRSGAAASDLRARGDVQQPVASPSHSRPALPETRDNTRAGATDVSANRVTHDNPRPGQSLERSDGVSAPQFSPRVAPWIPIGLAHDRMILFQSAEGIIVLHWRAARARILYEEILRQLRNQECRRQGLIFPITIELDSVASAVLEEYMVFFKGIGFDVEPFGRNFFRVEAVPDWFSSSVAERFIRDVVDRIRDRGMRPDQVEAAREHVAALAAFTAVQAEQMPKPESWPGLAAELFACNDPLTDPRGRVTFFELSRAELRRRLTRD